jgi:glycosyltransferase involved in cell wall biosynthesis
MRMVISVFIDIAMYSEQFVSFISPLGKNFGQLKVVSQYSFVNLQSDDIADLVANRYLSFVQLPFYVNTEEFYKKLVFILPKAIKTIKKVVRESDVVILRLRNSLAWLVAGITVNEKKPLALYWGGPPIKEIVKHNYPLNTPSHIAARHLARFEQALNRRITRKASLNFFIDPKEHQLMGSPENVKWVVPTLVSKEDLLHLPKPKNNFPIKTVFAGRLKRVKGIYDLLAAAVILKQTGAPIQVYIAGHGSERHVIERVINEQDLDGHVKLTGRLSHSDLQSLLKASDIFVLPSYAEGLPKVLWEAWAARMAVVMTDVGCIGNFVKHRRNGLIIKTGKPRELAAALKMLCHNENLRLSLAEAGIQTARKHTREQETHKMATAIGKLIHSRGGNISRGDLKVLTSERLEAPD